MPARAHFRALARTIAITAAALIAACSSSDPGPLKGEWRIKDTALVGQTITFRDGEIHFMGAVQKVSYEVKGTALTGHTVMVSSGSSPTLGHAKQYIILFPDAVKSDAFMLERVK